MNTKKKTIKKLLCYSTSFAMLSLASAGILSVANPNFYVDAAAEAGKVQVSINNSNFKDNTKSSYPFAPSDFDAYRGNVKSESTSDDNINAGVINLSSDDYVNKFANATRGSKYDKYVLMLDSTKDGAHQVNYGFRTKKPVEMSSNSNYVVSVDVYTEQNASIANLYLFNGEKVYSSIKNINSYARWTTHYFFVSTNEDALSLNVGMYLEGTGIALFDNISCFKANDTIFNQEMSVVGVDTSSGNSKGTNYSYVSENEFSVARFIATNKNSFVNLINNDEFELTKTSVPNKDVKINYVEDSDGTNSSALKFEIDEANKSYALFETSDDMFTVAPNVTSKISVTLKTKDLNGKVTLGLEETSLKTGQEGKNSELIEISSNTGSSSNINNDYETYSFFIRSHANKSSSFKLVFSLGNEENETSGKLFISQIEQEIVDFDVYDNAKTGSTAEKIDLTYHKYSTDIMLTNGDFNEVKTLSNKTYLSTPTGWSVSEGKNDQVYGVVNTNNFTADLMKLSNMANPGTHSKTQFDNENVLLMYNATNDTLSYTSETKKLDAKSYHKFSAKFKTFNSNVKFSLTTKKDEAEIELTSVVVNSLNWENADLYIYTGNQNIDVSLKITLETTNGSGYAFVDDTTFDFLIAPTADNFPSLGGDKTAVVNLANLFTSDSDDQWANANLFSSVGTASQTGVINLNSSKLLNEVIANPDDYTAFKSIGVDNVIGIRTMGTDDYHTLTSNVGYSLTANNRYKLSLKVFTQRMDLENVTNAQNVGAGIQLSGFDSGFTAIKSENDWTEFTFFISPTSDTTTYLTLSLGDETNGCKADAFFGDIKFEDITESVNESQFAEISESKYVKVLKTSEPKKDPENDKTADKSNQPSTNAWLYAIPTILFGVAIVIAIVGALSRKVKFKKPVKKSKNDYDRNATVSKQYYMRKATAMRENKLAELKKDMEKITAERSKYEEEYKKDLSQLRELKIKRAPQTEIAKFEKDMKKKQKLSASLGVTSNKIASQIQYVKTDAYIDSLIKKLAREQSKPSEEENKN